MERPIGAVAAIATVLMLAMIVATVPAVAITGSPTALPAQSTATQSSTFQVSVSGRSFTATLPTSSVATYTWAPGSSTVDSSETTTSGTALAQKLAQQPTIDFGNSSPLLPSIAVDPSTTGQTIAGFGGAMTDSSAYLINHSPKKSAILSALFGSSGADFNMVRLPLGASDFVANPTFQTYDDVSGNTSLSDFSISHDTTNIIPVVKSAKSANPDLKIIALPWSAPGWMKVSGHYLSSCSGSADFLKTADYPVYATYLTKAAKAYQDEGLPFSILSMQNEPHNCNSTYPTMMMEPSDQAKLSLDLSADLNNPTNGLTNPPQIMGWDHNWYDYNNESSSTPCSSQTAATYPESLLALSNAVSDIGYHSYCGNSSVQAALTSAYPNVGIFVTESTGFTKASNAAANLVYEVKNDLIDPIRNGAKASLYWNFALDQDCGPQFGGGTTCDTGTNPTYSGCMDCRPMVTVNNQTGTYTLNEDYYYWAQFSKFVEPGAKRIASTTVGSLDTVAFQNPPSSSGGNGQIVLVVLSGSAPTALKLSGVKTVASADGSYCAVLSTGGVDCWGYNAEGELGNGAIGGPDSCDDALECYDTPQAVTGIANVVSLTSDDFGGGYCAVLSTGGVDCWGDNTWGELGNGTIGGPDSCEAYKEDLCYDTPQAVTGIANAVSVTSHDSGYGAVLCATLSTGGVDCWGYNGDGELGNGTIGGPDSCEAEDSCYDTPQAVTGITEAVSLTTDDNSYCAVLSTGGVDCWGFNPDGELGNGTVLGPDSCHGGLDCYDTPQAVTGIANVVSLTSDDFGGYCAVLSTGGVDCWGDNSDGELGNGTIGGPDGGGVIYDTPQAVTGITDAISVDGGPDGADSYCAVLSTGRVDCWGANSEGDLGNGTIGGPDGGIYDTPQAVTGITEAVSVTGDDGDAYCAVLSTGGVDCWGYNGDGELGNGTIGGPDSCDDALECNDSPQAVTGIAEAVSLTSDTGDYCATLSTGRVECWGVNYSGQLGNGTTSGPEFCSNYDQYWCYDTPQAVDSP